MARTARAVRFGLFADAHYAERVYGDRYCRDAPAKLEACVAAFRQAEPDFVVCMGDLVDSAPEGGREAAYARTMAGIVGGFPGPRHWVLGNHDVQDLSKEAYLAAVGAAPASFHSFDCVGVHFAVLDGNCHADGRDFCAGDFSWDEAWVAPAQLDWLAADLAAARGRPAVILCHENLDHHLWEGALDPHVVRNAPDVRQVLEGAGNVCAVIQAHYHPGREVIQEGIPYLTLRAMVVGDGLRNNAWAVVAVGEDGTVQLTGGGSQRSWSAAVAGRLGSDAQEGVPTCR